MIGVTAALFEAGVQAADTAPPKSSAQAIMQGKTTFDHFCSACHGHDGKGGLGEELPVTPADLTSGQWKYGGSDEQIFHTIRKGVPPQFYMPAWEEQISESDTWNLVFYIRSLAKAPSP
jgi:mono/diheme cytochrome c family protein